MRPGHFREREYGIRYYRSSTAGIGGRLRAQPEDFHVNELQEMDLKPLDAATGDYPYLIVEVTLTDWDTHRFVDELASRLHIHPQRIGWAGTKDARAVTRQRLSIRGIDPEDLPSIDGATFHAEGRLGRQLEFGDHGGNRFELRVRGASGTERIPTITDELTNGDLTVFPNFFGPQRFGLPRPITHRVGKAIISDSYREAVRLYLAYSTRHEPTPTQEARGFIESVAFPEDRWDEALERIPGYLHHERAMVEVLSSAGWADEEACRAAIDALPWSLQRLFVHALQSYLFNEIVSERIRRSVPLDRPVVGDLICMVDTDGEVDTERPQRVDAARLGLAQRHCDRGRAVVTGPLLGSETNLGEGVPGLIERAVFEHAGLEPTSFERNRRAHEGTRRPVGITTDVDVTDDPLTFRFDLPPGSYATVVMREYLKGDPLEMA